MDGVEMRLKRLLLILFILIGCAGAGFSQIGSHPVFVKHIVIEAEHDPRFIWSIANATVPWEGLTTQSDVDCLKTKLTDTGVFATVAMRLHKLTEPDAFELVISLAFKRATPSYEIEDIQVKKLAGVDVDAVNRDIRDQQIVGTVLSLRTDDYATFEDRLRKLIQKHTEQDQNVSPSFRLEVSKDVKLRLFITEQPAGPCVISAKHP